VLAVYVLALSTRATAMPGDFYAPVTKTRVQPSITVGAAGGLLLNPNVSLTWMVPASLGVYSVEITEDSNSFGMTRVYSVVGLHLAYVARGKMHADRVELIGTLGASSLSLRGGPTLDMRGRYGVRLGLSFFDSRPTPFELFIHSTPSSKEVGLFVQVNLDFLPAAERASDFLAMIFRK
jgi:hypothetical protein